MAEFMDFLGIFIFIAIALIIKKSKDAGKPADRKGVSQADIDEMHRAGDRAAAGLRPERAYSEREARVQKLREVQQAAAYQRTIKGKDSATARSNYGRSAATFDSSLRAAATSAGHSSTSGQSLRSTTTLRDDRESDWLASQLRLERRIKASTDLGSQHEANCDARSLKAEHLPRHGRD